MSMPQTKGFRRLPHLFNLIAIATGIQLLAAAQANTGGVPAMYATKAEAEAAAKKHFNCTGAHQMGNQWMPCTTHGQSTGTTQHKH
jgi:hypothetical protein